MFNIKLNEFWKNISIVSGSSAFSQLIVLIAIPILSRLYSPDNFGLQSIYLSFSLILGSLFTLKFEFPIIFAKREMDSFNLFVLTFLFSAFFSLMLLAVLLIFGKFIFHFLEIKNNIRLTLSIVFTTFQIGLLTALLQYFNRQKKFRTSSISKIVQSVTNVVGSLIFAFIGIQKFGLIYGYLFGYTFSISYLLILNYSSLKLNYKDYVKPNNLKAAFKEYKDYPRIILPTTVFSILSAQIIPIILNKLYPATFVGYFAMSNRVALLPSIVIGSAIGSVLRTEISILENENKSIRPIFVSIFKKMLLAGIVIYGFLGILSPWLFNLVLGKTWYNAGVLTRSVVIYAFSIFMVQCFYDVLLVRKLYKKYFLIQMSLFLAITFSLFIGDSIFNHNPYYAVTTMAVSVFIVLMISLKVIYNSTGEIN